jgi:glutamine amidotransferase
MTGLAIIDAGFGNLHSISAAFRRLGADPVLTSDPALVESAARLVLPGVGSARFAMARLAGLGLIEPIRRRAGPMLGICLGMQLMFATSDEGESECLGLLPGSVRRLDAAPGRPVPHMGWSRIDDAVDGLGIKAGDYCYFAHSFACDDGSATAARTSYGRPIAAAVRQGRLWGAQFHPERSAAPGAAFLKAFLS